MAVTRVLVVGGAGQLGQAILRELGELDGVGVKRAQTYEVSAPSHQRLDVTDADACEAALTRLQPQVVINAAAFHDVPRCEREGERAFRVNTLGARHLALACERVGARLCQISTDYVFDGQAGRPYREDDLAAPLNLYGESKLAGERQALLHNPRTWVVRTTGLFGLDPCRAKPKGRNFVRLMLHLAATLDEVKVVSDVRCCPTYAVDLARQLRAMIEADAPFGVYHAVNPIGPDDAGGSWFDFARLIFETAGTQPRKLTAVDHRAFPDPAPRPLDSRLATERLRELGLLELRPLPEALAAYLTEEGRGAADG